MKFLEVSNANLINHVEIFLEGTITISFTLNWTAVGNKIHSIYKLKGIFSISVVEHYNKI